MEEKKVFILEGEDFVRCFTSIFAAHRAAHEYLQDLYDNGSFDADTFGELSYELNMSFAKDNARSFTVGDMLYCYSADLED